MAIRFFLFAILFLLMAGNALSNEIVRSKAELADLQQRISVIQQELSVDRDQADTVTTELDEIEQSLAHLQASIRLRMQNKSELEQNIVKLNQEASELETRNADAIQRLAGLLRSHYMMGRRSGLRLLISQEDPQVSVRQLAMFRYIMEARNQQLQNLFALQQAIQANQVAAEQQQQDLQSLISKLEIDGELLKKQEQHRAEKLSLINHEIESGEQTIVLYKKRELSLKKLLDELIRSKSVVQKQAPRQSNDTKEKYVLPKEMELSGFGNNRGKLPLPLEANIRVHYGQKKPESGLTWEGIMFDSHKDQPVTAVYQGQVVFSDWFRGYGQLMVVDHGEGYMSLYGYNQLLRVGVGDIVATGEVIAMAGDVAEVPSPGLYFEIRHNGMPDDPLQWCR